MARILAIDYGKKRVGLAVTDPMGMIPNPLKTIANKELSGFLENYIQEENIKNIVIGYPVKMDNTPSEMIPAIDRLIKKIEKKYSKVKLTLIDERFTSKIALQTMIDGGMKKSDRRDKSKVDAISATIILQSYLEQKNNFI